MVVNVCYPTTYIFNHFFVPISSFPFQPPTSPSSPCSTDLVTRPSFLPPPLLDSTVSNSIIAKMVNVTITGEGNPITYVDGEAVTYNAGDLAWILTSTALVMIMVPGLGFL